MTTKDKLIKSWAEDIEIDSGWTLNESIGFLANFYDKVVAFEKSEYEDLLRRTD